jgi:hypothetical protein
VYRVERSDGSGFVFVVNVGRGDSVLAPADPATLAEWWQPAPFEVLTPDAARRELAESTGGVGLWPWLLVVAGLLFAAEMYFVHRLCPQMNPAVAEPFVRRRGATGSQRQ